MSLNEEIEKKKRDYLNEKVAQLLEDYFECNQIYIDIVRCEYCSEWNGIDSRCRCDNVKCCWDFPEIKDSDFNALSFDDIDKLNICHVDGYGAEIYLNDRNIITCYVIEG